MERNRCTSSIGVPELAVRTTLANLDEAESLKCSDTSRGLRTGRCGIGSNHDRLRADKFRFESRISVLKQHVYDLSKILSEFVKCSTL